MRVRVYRCVVEGCDNHGEFPFPKPWEYFPTFLCWVRASGNRRILNTTPDKFYKSKKYYYCRSHFKPEDIVPYRRITRPKRLALPCLKLPQPLTMHDLRPLIGKTEVRITGNEEEETTFYMDYNLSPAEFNPQTFDALQALRPKKANVRPPSPVDLALDEAYLERQLKNESRVSKKKLFKTDTLADKLMMAIQSTILEKEEELATDSLPTKSLEEKHSEDDTQSPKPEDLSSPVDDDVSLHDSDAGQNFSKLSTDSKDSQPIKTYSKANPRVKKSSLEKQSEDDDPLKLAETEWLLEQRFNPLAEPKKVERKYPPQKPRVRPIVRDTFFVTDDGDVQSMEDTDEEQVPDPKKLVCRTCLKTIKDTNYYKICEYKHPVTEDLLEDMLNQLYPEMDTSITEEPLVCQKCYNYIEILIHFRMTCQLTEERIKSHQFKLMCDAKNEKSDRSAFNGSNHDLVDLSQLSLDDTSDKSTGNETSANLIEANPIYLDHRYTSFVDQVEFTTKNKGVSKSCQTDCYLTPELNWDFIDALKTLENANKDIRSVRSRSPYRKITNEEYFGKAPPEHISDIDSEVKRKLYERNIGLGPYLCEYCAKIYKCLNRYKKHIKKRHTNATEVYKSPVALCTHCGKAFRSEAKHYVHQRVEHGNETFHCPRCTRKYLWRSKGNRYTLSAQKFERNICHICKKSFYNAYIFNKHMYHHRRQKKPKPIKPHRDNFKLDTAYSRGTLFRNVLNPRRIQTATEKPKNKEEKSSSVVNFKLSCPLCSERYTDQLEYIEHLNWHNSLPEFRCQSCNRLIPKQKIREGDDRVREYYCDDCKKLHIVELLELQPEDQSSEQMSEKPEGGQ